MMMTSTFRRYAAKGFTLIELLIVVIIIAILAAIAIPQFSNTSTDAQESASIANLTTMRSAIELYRVQHNNTYPSTFVAGAPVAPACAGVAGVGVVNTNAAFIEQLTQFTDPAGRVCSIASPGYIYGPYLRAIPVEPVTNAAAVTVVTAVGDQLPGAATTGWRFVNTTGALQINSTRVARDGVTALSAK